MPSATEVGALFDRVAPWYDRMNRRMSLGLDRHWRFRAVGAVDNGAGQRILDLGTGTADLAIAVALQAGATVVGVDFSSAMLTLGQDKVGRADLGRQVLLLRGDASNLPFPADSFDGVMNAFLLRNLVDLRAAFAEMARVVRPGGQVVCLEIAYPRFPPWRAVFRLYFDRFVPLLGRWLTQAAPAYRYLPESLAKFPTPPEILAALAESGWEAQQARSVFPGTVMLYTAVLRDNPKCKETKIESV